MTPADLATIKARCEAAHDLHVLDAIALIAAYEALQKRCDEAEGLLLELSSAPTCECLYGDPCDCGYAELEGKVETYLREHELIGGSDGR